MHAVEAKQLARMDGTALKAYFALIGAGPSGLSSEECADAVQYGIRQVQIALRTLVETGRATINRAGRLIRYVAVTTPSLASQGDPQPGKTGSESSQSASKDMRVNVMLNTVSARFPRESPLISAQRQSGRAVRGHRQDCPSREP